MHSSGILDSVVNRFVHHMVFVGNVQQKSAIASHLKGLDPSLFCCQGPALTGIKDNPRS